MLAIAKGYRLHHTRRFYLCLELSYVPDMALAHPSPRSSADATRPPERARLAVVVALEQGPGARAAHAGDRERRERVRMELLVARAVADRRR
jgi:hypothetical protein